MKPVASLSLDADNQWSYEMIRGEADWESAPSYLGRMVPRVLDLLAARDLFITFFLIGRDAATDGDAFAALAAAGPRDRQPLVPPPAVAAPLLGGRARRGARRGPRTRSSATTGVRPAGFRGPGYSLSEPTLRVLVRRGYEYDASTLPTVIGPIARTVYFRRAQLDDDPARRARAPLRQRGATAPGRCGRTGGRSTTRRCSRCRSARCPGCGSRST